MKHFEAETIQLFKDKVQKDLQETLLNIVAKKTNN